MMAAFPVGIGTDEIATETQKMDGYTFYCLPQQNVSEFTKDTQSILKTAGLDGFHGKEFRPQHAGAYRDFVGLAFEYLKKSPQSFAACRLFSAKVKTELASFSNRLVEGAVGKSLAPGHSSIAVLQPYFFPLACLAVLSRELAPEVEMHVEMDSHTSLKELDQQVHQMLGVPIPAATLLKGLYNGYAKQLHPRTPLLPDDGVVVLEDEASALIQAADVIGNFATAHMFVRVGKATSGRVAKSQILEAVLGSDINVFDPAGKVLLSGQDLVLADDGSLTFRIAWEITKPPEDPKLMEGWPKDDGFIGDKSKP
jgi:hypothetical protein